MTSLPPPDMPPLGVHLLGERALRRGDQDVSAAIHYRKGWALLGYLALERERMHSREHLAQLLWPQLSAAAARTNLRQVVADLKQALDTHGGGEALQVNRDHIGLFASPALNIDVQALEAAAGHLDDDDALQAEQRAQGFGAEFLAGASLADCLEFEEWLQLTRRRLALAAEAALQRLCALQEIAGRLAQAIATARRLAALDEWNESHQRLLMRLLARSGEPALALSVFDRFNANLRAELDSEPERETRELRERIEQQARRGDDSHGLAADAGARRWISAVYCEVRSNADETQRVGHCLEVLGWIGDSLRREGGWVLPVAGRTVMACFHGRPMAGDCASQAARAAARVRERFGAEVALALCSGLARVEVHGGALTVLGNPAEWALRLCLQAQVGQVVLCESMHRQLRGRYQMQPMPARPLPGVARPVAVWELGSPLAEAAGDEGARDTPDVGGMADAAGPAAAGTALDPHETQRMAQEAARGTRTAWLQLLTGNGARKRIAVEAAPVVIGRSADSDLQILHRTVSRYHCAVWRDGDRYRIRDMGSTNRTRINDATVQEAELGDGDRILLGDTELTFVQDPSPRSRRLD